MSDDMPDLPAVATIPTPEIDHDKAAAIRAATYYEFVEKERAELRRLVEQANTALEVKDHQIAMLQTELAAERNRYESLNNCYLEVLEDRADLEATLAVERDSHEDRAARLAKFEFSRIKRKSSNGNGKRNGSGKSVPDVQGSTPGVAGSTSEMASASGRAVLEQAGSIAGPLGPIAYPSE